MQDMDQGQEQQEGEEHHDNLSQEYEAEEQYSEQYQDLHDELHRGQSCGDGRGETQVSEGQAESHVHFERREKQVSLDEDKYSHVPAEGNAYQDHSARQEQRTEGHITRTESDPGSAEHLDLHQTEVQVVHRRGRDHRNTRNASLRKAMISLPTNFQHVTHVRGEGTVAQSEEEMRNLLQMVMLYQEQLGVSLREGVARSGQGRGGCVDATEEWQENLMAPSKGRKGVFIPDSYADMLRSDDAADSAKDSHTAADSRCESVDAPRSMMRRPDTADQASKDVTRTDHAPQPSATWSTLPGHHRTKGRKLRKDMIGTPTDFQHVMGSGLGAIMGDQHEAAAQPNGTPTVEEDRAKTLRPSGTTQPLPGLPHPPSPNLPPPSPSLAHTLTRPAKLRKDLIGPPTDFKHVEGAGLYHTLAQAQDKTIQEPTTPTQQDTQGQAASAAPPHTHHTSSTPTQPPPPSAIRPPPPPLPTRPPPIHPIRGATPRHPGHHPSRPPQAKGGKVSKDMIGGPTNFQHVQGAGLRAFLENHHARGEADTAQDDASPHDVPPLALPEDDLVHDNGTTTSPTTTWYQTTSPTTTWHQTTSPTTCQGREGLSPDPHVTQTLLRSSGHDTRQPLLGGEGEGPARLAPDAAQPPGGVLGAAAGGGREEGHPPSTEQPTSRSPRTRGQPRIRKSMIGAPSNFQHVSHTGLDQGQS